jgi:UDP-glucose 4-epimerase
MISNKFDYVFHYAAVVGVKRTLNNPLWVLNDIKGIENILNLSKNTGVKRVFFSSSSEVYGEPFEHPQNENTTPLNSKLPYAVVKNVAEAYIRSFQKEFGLEYTIFRFFNTYGPKQSKDFVVKKFIKLAIQNENITIYGDGLQTRTFCFIDDNIEACATCLFENKFINDTLNIGSDIEITIKDLAELIIKVTKSASKIKFLPALEEGDMTRRKPDISKMKTLLKKDFTSLENGILKVLESVKK